MQSQTTSRRRQQQQLAVLFRSRLSREGGREERRGRGGESCVVQAVPLVY